LVRQAQQTVAPDGGGESASPGGDSAGGVTNAHPVPFVDTPQPERPASEGEADFEAKAEEQEAMSDTDAELDALVARLRERGKYSFNERDLDVLALCDAIARLRAELVSARVDVADAQSSAMAAATRSAAATTRAERAERERDDNWNMAQAERKLVLHERTARETAEAKLADVLRRAREYHASLTLHATKHAVLEAVPEAFATPDAAGSDGGKGGT
jgi:hypothetical protein